jgi:hypothetical protein
MQVYEKKTIAKILDLSPSYISQAIKRNKLTQTSDGFIDAESAINKKWIEAIAIKKGIDLAQFEAEKTPARKPTKIKNKKREPGDDIASELEELTGDVRKIAEKKVLAEIEYKQGQIRLNQIKENKMMGDLMPTDSVENLFHFSIETVRTTYLQEVRSIAEIFRQKMELGHEEFVEIQKDLTISVNNITKVLKQNLMLGIEDIVNEYKEVRGRGESK